MRPILFSIDFPFIGELHIHSYGFMLALGFIVAITIAVRESQRVGLDPEKILNLIMFVLIFSIVGARLFHCIVFYESYLTDPLRIFKLWEGGLVFFGGFIGGVSVTIWYCWYSGMNFWTVGDLVIPLVALGLSFGRIGCLCAGCCYGKPVNPDFPFAMIFSDPSGIGIKDTPLYPTQLISSLNAFGIFLLVWFLRKRKQFEGQLLAIFLVIYSITRSLIELLRDDPRGFVELFSLRVSESQLVSIVMILIAVAMFAILPRRQKLRDFT